MGKRSRWLGPLGVGKEMLAEVVWPSVCGICERMGEVGAGRLCAQCQQDLNWIGQPNCRICGRPAPMVPQREQRFGDFWLCQDCEHDPPSLAFLRSAVMYEGPVVEMISEMKFYRDFGSMVRCAQLLRGLDDELLARWLEFEPVVVPIPMSALRRLRRGYNQALWLARLWARFHGLPLANVLRRRRNRGTQVGMTRAQRLGGWQGVYGFSLGGRAKVVDRPCILVDDVVTTAATLDQAARVLLRAGASEVAAVTVARQRGY